MEDKLFDEVAMAEVTHTLDIKNIQAQIADELGLAFTRRAYLEEPLNYMKEARKLFWKIVNHSEEKPDFNAIAVEIVTKCAGLPVAITTIANALKSRDLSYWKNDLQ
ncbi:hypothetical protein Ddye_015272 [Dipteronia dyeriana]|uniref:NB-ARC domain-containing protein n=1 Tax=Dipteronia dyeriana TaxID=168575 RepID=A0AAD9U5A0_9ROSI|nr:hypothetical protein Ddye_015272 [Dipteronia dyeriana]